MFCVRYSWQMFHWETSLSYKSIDVQLFIYANILVIVWVISEGLPMYYLILTVICILYCHNIFPKTILSGQKQIPIGETTMKVTSMVYITIHAGYLYNMFFFCFLCICFVSCLCSFCWERRTQNTYVSGDFCIKERRQCKQTGKAKQNNTSNSPEYQEWHQVIQKCCNLVSINDRQFQSKLRNRTSQYIRTHVCIIVNWRLSVGDWCVC